VSSEEILKQLRETVHHPASVRELIQLLRIPREEKASFRRQIKNLVASGDLVQIRGNRVGLVDKMDLVVGRLQTHAAGYGFVVPERHGGETRGDVYIAALNLKEAMHGDRVVARIEHYKDAQRAEGRIIRILERTNTTIVGRYDRDKTGFGFVSPFDRRLLTDVHIPDGEAGGAAPGEMVTVEVVRWPTATRGPLGRIIEVLGAIDAPGVDTRIIIRKYNLPDAHGDEAVREATRLGREVRDRDLKGRTDFRTWPTVTIDGEHARDFDDAITIETLPNGHYFLGVHIADVAHYVEEGGALDAEAFERGTSVYFPERAVHMFPPELATGLCSLNPDVDRLVQSCLMEVDDHGEVVRYELHDGVIHSDARMTYTAVNAILTDRDAATRAEYAHLVPMFETMAALYEVLHRRRRRRGSIDFDLPEPEVVLDEAGLIEEIVAAERNVAHRLIEEFMLLANETVARHLEERTFPTVYRVHEPPDPLKVEQFEAFISTLGYSLAAPIAALEPRHFQHLVERIAGAVEEKPIAALMLRTMQQARYDAANLGHFGLAAATYTHFTSPIRRYPDLVVHRTLRECRAGKLKAERREELDEELPEIARHTSERERRAVEAERELVQWKKVRFMADKVGDEFDGYITAVTAFGLFVELVEHFVEGLVHVSTMADDYYRYLEATHSLRGENTRKMYRIGDKVSVQVIRVDMERRQVDLGLVDVLEHVRQQAGVPAARTVRGGVGERRTAPRHGKGPEKRRGRRQRPGRRERRKKR
jgi:ribonuclease R